ncbi:MAG: nucleotidyltransferase family protein [Erythrobacter sp.]
MLEAISASTSSEFEGPSNAEARLLLLASLPGWDEGKRNLAGDLIEAVERWDFVLDAAVRKYALPIVYDNISSLQSKSVPSEFLAKLKENALKFHIQNLHRRSLFEHFHHDCISGNTIDYAYFKGPVLADRFYDRPICRYFRDIDLLVRPNDRVSMLEIMLEKGCKIIDFDGESPVYPSITDKSDLRRYNRLTATPHLVTPGGLLVEVHNCVERIISSFDTEDLLDRSVTMKSGRHQMRIIPDSDHVVLLCYHHTGHLWSKLNWLADIDMVLKSPLIDGRAVADCASRYKLGSTVDAVFGMHALIANGHNPAMPVNDQNALDLLRSCAAGLEGDRDLEYEMRAHNILDTLAFSWQGMPITYSTRAKLLLRRFLPTDAELRAESGGPVRQTLSFALHKIKKMPRAIRREFFN